MCSGPCAPSLGTTFLLLPYVFLLVLGGDFVNTGFPSLPVSLRGDSRASGSSRPVSRGVPVAAGEGAGMDAAAPLLSGIRCFRQGRNAKIAVGMCLGERGPWWHGLCMPTPEQKGFVTAGKKNLQGCGMGLDGWVRSWGCCGTPPSVQRISASYYISNRR